MGLYTMNNEVNAPRLTIVVPCYNESEGLQQTTARLLTSLADLEETGRVSGDSLLCFVDDGSVDETWNLIQDATDQHSNCCGLRLTRNFGHQNALLAGMLSVPGDIVVTMDADLQDDPSIMPAMLDAHAGGAEVVFAVRSSRKSDNWLKRSTARVYYRLLNAMGVEVVIDHADYRLMSRRVIESLRDYKEVNLFLRGLIPQLGYCQAVVEYERAARASGRSKYSPTRMIALAINGVTSLTAYPLRAIALTGVVIFIGSIAMSAWALWIRLFTDGAVPGWASSVLPIYFLGGIQLLSIAVVGEYVSKIYLESKARPRFLVQEIAGALMVSKNGTDNGRRRDDRRTSDKWDDATK